MGHEPNYDKGEIEELIYGGGKVDKLVAAINLKDFYNDLHDTLVNKKFKDILNDPDGEFLDNQTKAGEFTDNKPNMNRTGDMFEKKFYWVKKSESALEMEMEWYAKKKSEITEHGWFEVKIYLVCRHIVEVEKLVGNKKIKLQSGGWEFRNEIKYKNNMIKKYLHNIPIVKNHKFLQKLYFESMYAKKIEQDIHFAEQKIFSIIYNVIDKHFGTHITH